MSGTLEFVIPLCREDLLKQRDSCSYVVLDAPSESELMSKIDDCRTAFSENGPSAILECFNIFYGLIKSYNEVIPSVRDTYWDVAVNAVADAYRHLAEDEDLASLEPLKKHEERNVLKMLVYALVQLVEEAVNTSYLQPPSATQAPPTKGHKGKKKGGAVRGEVEGGGLDWRGEFGHVVQILYQLLQLDLQQLWDPPSVTVMEDFTNLVANACYKLCEVPALAKDKALRTDLFLVLGTVGKRYNQPLSVALKMLQLLQSFEHLVTPLAQGTEVLVNSCSAGCIIVEMVNELGSKDPRDLSLDTSGTKNFAAFLVEMAQCVPNAVLPVVTSLLPHMQGESHFMRNGVLGVFGELVVQLLSGSELSDQQRNTREQLLDNLQNHIHDVNAFVRSKALQIWIQLCQAKAIPLARQMPVLELGIGRLLDKSSNVRKSALQLLTEYLAGNPFSSKLSEQEFKERLVIEEGRLKSALPSEPITGGGEAQAIGGLEQTGAIKSDCLHDGNDQTRMEEVAKQMAVIQYLRHALSFTQSMSQCIPVAAKLLGSKVTSDIFESLCFISVAVQFRIKGASECLRHALGLIWSREQQICDALVSTYCRVYLTPTQGQDETTELTNNLLSLVDGATCSELASLEKLLGSLPQSTLPPSVEKQLWDLFKRTTHQSRAQNARNALLILSMVSDRTSVHSHLEALVQRGLDTRGSPDLTLAKHTCTILRKFLSTKKKKGSASEGAEKPVRLAPDHPLFHQLVTLMVVHASNPHTLQWCPFAEQAVSTMYCLAEHPDKICASLLKALAARVLGTRQSSGGDEEVDMGAPLAASSQDPSQKVESSAPPPVNPLFLSRLLHVVGHVAEQQMIHLEVSISTELKRRSMVEEEEEEGKRRKGQGTKGQSTQQGELSKTPKTTGPKRRPVSAKKHQDTTSDQSTAEEMGLSGATAEDVEAEMMKRVCEQEVMGTGLLASFEPVIVGVVVSPSLYPCPALQASAALALAKFMLVSGPLCDKYLQLLFTILEKSSLPVVRANAIVSIGDLAFRFPNMIEPWTPHIYARLQDSDTVVRRNTLTVLTHLILNDMVKVKGHISEMVMCLKDSDCQILELAKVFFRELSQKGNALYNILPDIISRLSDPQRQVAQDDFQDVMRYLLSFIRKDKQNETLIEKLCHRFQIATTPRHSRDLAYCLAQLSISEKGVRKLQESFNSYKDKLQDDEVYSSFSALLGRAKSSAKPEAKATVEELESKMLQAHTKGLEEGGGASQPPQGQAGSGAGSKAVTASEGPSVEDEKEEERTQKPEPILPKKTKAKRSKKLSTQTSRKPLAEKNCDDGFDSDDDFKMDALSSARKIPLSSKVTKTKRRVAPLVYKEELDDVL